MMSTGGPGGNEILPAEIAAVTPILIFAAFHTTLCFVAFTWVVITIANYGYAQQERREKANRHNETEQTREKTNQKPL